MKKGDKIFRVITIIFALICLGVALVGATLFMLGADMSNSDKISFQDIPAIINWIIIPLVVGAGLLIYVFVRQNKDDK